MEIPYADVYQRMSPSLIPSLAVDESANETVNAVKITFARITNAFPGPTHVILPPADPTPNAM
jgi:hypothetical protein